MPRVFIPAQLRELTGEVAELELPGDTVRQIVAALDQRFPGLGARLATADGLAPGLAVSVDGRLSSRGLFAPLQPNSEIHFLPAIGGG